MTTKFDIGDIVHLPVRIVEIKFLESGQEIYKIDIPGAGIVAWYSVQEFVEGKEDEPET